MGAVADAQTRAQAQGLVDGATGWVSSREMVHDGQDRLVVFSSDSGAEPGVRTGEEFPQVQVLVRGPRGDSDAAKAKLRAIRDDLQGLLDVTIDGTRYVSIRALAEPANLGFDDNGRPQFTQSFRFKR